MSELILDKPIQKRKSKVLRELNAIITIFARDMTLVFKSPSSLIVSLAMPIMMMGLIGGNLLQNMSGGLGFNYKEFMLVGTLINMLFMMTSMGMTSLVEDHTTDFTQEMLISPVSRYSIAIGKIFGSAFGAIISCVGTIIVGLFMGISISLGKLLLILALSPLMCLSAGALALILIGVIKSNKTANMAVSLLTMPQMFLSGAIIPISHSSGILLVLSRMMPMTYCIDLARAVLYAGKPEYSSVVLFNPVVNCIAIVGITVVCLVVGTFLFARSEKKK